MFPLVGRSGGVLQRRGHTEASLDLARLAGSTEAAYICEILKDDGTMARKADLHAYAEKWHLTMIEVGDIARYVSFQDSPKVTLRRLMVILSFACLKMRKNVSTSCYQKVT